MIIGYTTGVFDLFHIGHLNILQRGKEFCETLIAGVSSDVLNYSKKSVYPIYNQGDRMKIVKAITYVDDVFLEESLALSNCGLAIKFTVLRPADDTDFRI